MLEGHFQNIFLIGLKIVLLECKIFLINILKLNKHPPKEQLNLLISSYKEKNFKKAEDIALKITNSFSEHALAWNILGLIHESKNEFSKALKAYQIAIKTSF